MKILFLSLSIFLLGNMADAQRVHLNLFGGATNYQGDLQDKNYTFNQAHLAGGLGLSYDLTDQFSIRGSALFGKISGDDKYGRNKARNLNFTSKLAEAQLALEYYIYPLADHSLTPYVFAGIAMYHFSPYTYDTSNTKVFLSPLSTEGQGFVDGIDEYKRSQFAIPFGGGVKLSLSENINVGLEVGFRKLFTDYLDDVSNAFVDKDLLLANRGPQAVELAFGGDELKSGAQYPAGGTMRGGPDHKDWYYFTGLTLSFRLGNGNGGGLGKRSEYGCPVNVN
jgi:opacity protein-like surface antigen